MNDIFSPRHSEASKSGSSGSRALGASPTQSEESSGHLSGTVKVGPSTADPKAEDSPFRGQVTKEDVIRRLKYSYAFAQKEPSSRILDSLMKLVHEGLKPGGDIVQFLTDVARMIDKHLQIKATTIGIRDPKDGKYRYVAMSGLTGEQWQHHRSLSYTFQEFFDPVKYRGTMISDRTKLFLAEDTPYNPDEIGTFNSKLAAAMVRRNPDDANEADYLDFFIRGPGDELLGWIETGCTSYGKIPDAKSIRWIEAIAMVLGLVLTIRGYSTSNGRR
jgi:hypothetical protein